MQFYPQLLPLYNNGYNAEDTWRYTCVVDVAKTEYEHNMPSFFLTLKNLPKLHFWLILVDFFLCKVNMLYTSKFVYDVQDFFRFR